MMNRDHGPSGLPSGGAPPTPLRYPRLTFTSEPFVEGEENSRTGANAMESRPAPTVKIKRTPIPGPLERAIAAAQQPGVPAASPPAQPQVVLSDMAAAKAAANANTPAKPAATIGAAAAAAKKPSPPPSPPSASKPRYKKRTKKYNNFNIFFMLERQLLLQSRGGGIDAVAKPIDTSDSPLTRYKDLHLPPLCRRYNHLPLTSNWFLELLANQNKKRPHRKSHGLIPFKELAQTVAQNYREIDDETQAFVNEVAERLGWHCEEAEAIEARERRHGEAGELGVARGAGAGAGGSHHERKRKDAPVVSVAAHGGVVDNDAVIHTTQRPGRALSGDEAATVQQLMGMKTNSPTAALAQPPHQHQPHPPHQARPALPQVHPMAHHPMGGKDVESERLRIELAQAMTARRDSEQRIRLLKEQMIRHDNARAQHCQHQHHQQDRAARDPSHHSPQLFPPGFQRGAPPGNDRYLAGLLAAARGSPPLLSRRPPPGRGVNHPGLQEAEKALLKEALARRLVPTGSPLEPRYPGSHAALRGGAASAPNPRDPSEVPLKKRQRFSFEGGEAEEEANVATKSNEQKDGEQEGVERPLSETSRPRSSSEGFFPASARTAGGDRPASANQDEIGFYRDLYAELLGANGGPRYPHAPPPDLPRHTPSPRDAALLDLARSLAGSSGPGPVERALYENLASRAGGAGNHGRRGGPPPPAHFSPPLARYPPPPPPGPSYALLLSQLASSRGAPLGPPLPQTLCGPPRPPHPSCPERARAGSPSRQSLLEMVHAASSRSQFSLSYGEIMDVWKEMKGNKEGGGNDAGGQFSNAEEELARQHLQAEQQQDVEKE